MVALKLDQQRKLLSVEEEGTHNIQHVGVRTHPWRGREEITEGG